MNFKRSSLTMNSFTISSSFLPSIFFEAGSEVIENNEVFNQLIFFTYGKIEIQMFDILERSVQFKLWDLAPLKGNMVCFMISHSSSKWSWKNTPSSWPLTDTISAYIKMTSRALNIVSLALSNNSSGFGIPFCYFK